MPEIIVLIVLVLLTGFLTGYALGRRIGRTEGEKAGAAKEGIELREDVLKRGVCRVCGMKVVKKEKVEEKEEIIRRRQDVTGH